MAAFLQYADGNPYNKTHGSKSTLLFPMQSIFPVMPGLLISFGLVFIAGLSGGFIAGRWWKRPNRVNLGKCDSVCDENDNDESSDSEKQKSHKTVTPKASPRIRKKKTFYALTNGECCHKDRNCSYIRGKDVQTLAGVASPTGVLIVQFALCKQCAMDVC